MKTKRSKKHLSRGRAPDKTRSKSKVKNRSGDPAGATSRKPRTASLSLPVPVGFPIVGVGASAGGLEAFTELLQNLPTDTGMAFVLVQHLDPAHASALTRLLTRATSMPVQEVTQNLRIEPNCVYVIPPNTNMGVTNRYLKLRPREVAGGAHRSVDHFFESLAEDQRERAIGVILSGTASDGTQGLEAIKAEGGITFAQDESAKYNSMPRSAVAAGCVDFVLSPENIAKELAHIARHPYVVAGAPLEDTAGAAGGHKPLPQSVSRKPVRKEKEGFNKIVALLGKHCGVDFSLYKSATIQRRINRRIVLNKLTTLEAYARLLGGNAKELEALYSDVLIPVTGFFRNAEAFEVLKRAVFPRLIPERSDEPVRMWVSGCSTGQEAYSLAMVFTEFTDPLPRAPKLQIFATDLNAAVLDKARAGFYPKTVVQDAGVSHERLRRFFVAQDGGYRICKPVREAIVFSRQNLLSDPPFSRLDFVSCRNVLIYIEPSLHQKILPTFHYALKPNGFLFLGASESVGSFKDIFEPVDKKHKIYFKKPGPTRALHFHFAPRREDATKESHGLPAPRATEGLHGDLKALREADRVALARHAPPGVLVNAGLQVLQFRGDTSPYLKPPSGRASFDLLKMAREGLLLPLRAAFDKARKDDKAVRMENVPVYQDGQTRRTNIEVTRLKNLTEACYLIFFEEAKERGLPAASASTIAQRQEIEGTQTRQQGTRSEGRAGASRAERSHIAELDSELAATRDYMQSIQEQNEAANEELQASNEEVTSANEELQSLNEELETSKEELESANEELSTVNEEMAARNAELSHLNSDLVNFQSSASLAIVLLGRDLIIRRFTAQAEKHFNLLASDMGRSISKVRHNLKLPHLERLIAEVIDTVREQEREVQDEDGRWCSLRVRPYLSLDNKVDGAVLVLVDIDALKRTERTLVEAREVAEAIIRTVPEALLVLNADLRIHSANDAFCRTFKISQAQMVGRFIFDLDHGSWNIPKLRVLLEDIVPRDSFFNDVEITHDFERLGRRTLLLNARLVNEPGGQPKIVLVGIRDMTELLRLQAETRRSELRYRRLFEAAKDGVLIIDPATRKILDANPFMTELLGYEREELVGKEPFEIGLLDDEGACNLMFRELQKKGLILHENLLLRTKTSEHRYVEMISHLYAESEEKVIQCKLRDITERKQAEDALRAAQAQLADRAGQLEQAVAERTRALSATNQQLQAFVYCIAHDLRAPLRSMQGFSNLLVEEFAGVAVSDTGRDFANRISGAAQLMDAMLADLLAFSEISQQPIELSPLNLEPVVQSVLSRVEKEIQEKKASVSVSGQCPTVLAHEPTLNQVLFNLVSNALKFVKAEGAPLIRLRAEAGGKGLQPAGSRDVPARSGGQQAGPTGSQKARGVCPTGFVRVYVEDNGVGIAPEHQEQIFRIFTRLHGGRHPGRGIGLAIVQQGVERMGGRVGVDSTPGQGSSFWFELRKA